VLLFSDKTSEHKKALLYSKEMLNLFCKASDRHNIDQSQMYFMHAMVYYKLSQEAQFEAKRISLKSSSFDFLKIALEVRLTKAA
jgi:hypothetical protein